MKEVRIGNKVVGKENPVFIIGEIGLNHNGDINIAKKLIDMAVKAGADAVKFQKRTPEVCVPEEQKSVMRETPWGNMTYLDYRYRVEFEDKEYKEIDKYCKEKGIIWFASPWDEESVDFLESKEVPCYKVASASLTDDGLLKKMRDTGKPIILSTGMSTEEEIDHAVEILGKENTIILHANSTYPAPYEDLNLSMINTLREKYPEMPIGYSGHETGLMPTLAAVVLGANVVERHITLDRSMWGSDHSASLEPRGFETVIRDIRLYEVSKGDGVKKVYETEIPIKKKLRRK